MSACKAAQLEDTLREVMKPSEPKEPGDDPNLLVEVIGSLNPLEAVDM